MPAPDMATFVATIPAKPAAGTAGVTEAARIVCYNCNGLRAWIAHKEASRKTDLLSWVAAEAPDVLCLQETKVDDGWVGKERVALSSLFGAALPHNYWGCSTVRKGERWWGGGEVTALLHSCVPLPVTCACRCSALLFDVASHPPALVRAHTPCLLALGSLSIGTGAGCSKCPRSLADHTCPALLSLSPPPLLLTPKRRVCWCGGVQPHQAPVVERGAAHGGRGCCRWWRRHSQSRRQWRGWRHWCGLTDGSGDSSLDGQGRVLTLVFPRYVVVNV